MFIVNLLALSHILIRSNSLFTIVGYFIIGLSPSMKTLVLSANKIEFHMIRPSGKVIYIKYKIAVVLVLSPMGPHVVFSVLLCKKYVRIKI